MHRKKSEARIAEKIAKERSAIFMERETFTDSAGGRSGGGGDRGGGGGISASARSRILGHACCPRRPQVRHNAPAGEHQTSPPAVATHAPLPLRHRPWRARDAEQSWPVHTPPWTRWSAPLRRPVPPSRKSRPRPRRPHEARPNMRRPPTFRARRRRLCLRRPPG